MKKKEIFENYIQIQEYERQRIAKELHDTSLQTLAHVVQKLELAGLYIDKDPNMSKLEIAEISKLVKQVSDEIRNSIYNLRPMTFDDLGFKEAVENALRDMNSKSLINYIYNIEDIDFPSNTLKLEFYRCIMECIKNSEAHSQGKNIIVNISCQDGAKAEIIDDGVGFNVSDYFSNRVKHYGLSIIQERVNMMGGVISIDSTIGKGTIISIFVPL